MNGHRFILFFSVLFLTVCCPALTAQEHPAESVPSQDRNFLMRTVFEGRYLEELGKLAAGRAASGAVRQFGRHISADLSKFNGTAAELASERKIELPPAMGPSRRKTLERFGTLRGAEFDREFMSLMIDELEMYSGVFTKEAASGTDPGIRKYASDRLAWLDQSLLSARRILEGLPAPLLK